MEGCEGRLNSFCTHGKEERIRRSLRQSNIKGVVPSIWKVRRLSFESRRSFQKKRGTGAVLVQMAGKKKEERAALAFFETFYVGEKGFGLPRSLTRNGVSTIKGKGYYFRSTWERCGKRRKRR